MISVCNILSFKGGEGEWEDGDNSERSKSRKEILGDKLLIYKTIKKRLEVAGIRIPKLKSAT